MVVEATKYEGLLVADGGGAFDRVEYGEDSRIVLRSSFLKTADISGSIRFYFNSKREEVATGRKFDPVSGQWLMRPGSVFRVYTNIVFDKPIPKGVRAEIIPTTDAADVLMIVDPILREGFVGRVAFTLIPFRRIEIDPFESLARIEFSEDSSVAPKESKSTNYSRQKKSSAKTKKGTDESSTPDEHAESEEA